MQLISANRIQLPSRENTCRINHKFSTFQYLVVSAALIFTTEKIKFSIQNFFSKDDLIHKKLRIWSHLLKIYLMENLIFLYSALSAGATEKLPLVKLLPGRLPHPHPAKKKFLLGQGQSLIQGQGQGQSSRGQFSSKHLLGEYLYLKSFQFHPIFFIQLVIFPQQDTES